MEKKTLNGQTVYGLNTTKRVDNIHTSDWANKEGKYLKFDTGIIRVNGYSVQVVFNPRKKTWHAPWVEFINSKNHFVVDSERIDVYGKRKRKSEGPQSKTVYKKLASSRSVSSVSSPSESSGRGAC